MKKLNEIDVQTLRIYARNKEDIEKIQVEIESLCDKIEVLKLENEFIELWGKIELKRNDFSTDDIPF